MSPLLQIPVLHRMGLTVLHALWELALIALLVWVGLHLLRRRSARSRYLLACGGLAAMVLGPVLTWFLITPSTLMDAQLIQAVGTIAGEAAPTKGAFTFSEWLFRIHGMAPWAAVLWCVGFTLMLARLAAGLWWLDRAYLATACPASQSMQAMLNRLAERMGVTQSVRLLESAKAESPRHPGALGGAAAVESHGPGGNPGPRTGPYPSLRLPGQPPPEFRGGLAVLSSLRLVAVQPDPGAAGVLLR